MANKIFELGGETLEALGLEGTKTFFSHTHNLRLCSFKDDYTVSCNCCDQIIRGPIPAYCCIECEFYIHICCLEIPEKVDQLYKLRLSSISFFWQHLLHITPLDKGESRDCKACTRSIRGVSLRCSSCHFDLHVSCSKPAQRALKHKAHKHRLFYFSEKWLSSFMKCNFCDENFEGCNFYRCVDCDVNFHVECIPLPRVVKNDKSHQHPVKLLSSLGLVCDREEYCCDVCKEQGNAGHHVYYCDECNFMAHIECVLLQDCTLEIENFESNQDKSDGEDEINRIKEIHLSQEHSKLVEHKFYPQHPLSTSKCLNEQESSITCNACTKEITRIMYNCSTCGFSLHVSCAHKPRIEALKRDCHKHNLFYFVENENSFSCQKCCKKCKGGFYRCSECNINFHVDCIPLPRVMVLMKQTARYLLTFNLLDFVTEDDSDDVYDQHCEFCEKTARNCEDHVYYCQEAEFFAHIECLLAE
ncbi:hypothetical protein CICLE_v10003469mg, partial [Citrus x clementina]